jgi:DNA-binding response OmpR family regulator
VKRNVVLISNFADDLTDHGASGEAKTGRTQNTFDIISLALEEIDVAIVDLGANLQSLTIVEALTHTKPAPPVIALVDGDDGKPISELHQHGAAACLKKPFSADELARLIEALCASTSHRNSCSCDKWGHVCASCRGKT